MKKGKLVALEPVDMPRAIRLCYAKAFADLKKSAKVVVKFSTVKTVENNGHELDEEFMSLKNLSACVYALSKALGGEVTLTPRNNLIPEATAEGGEVYSEWVLTIGKQPFKEDEWELKAPPKHLLKRESSAVSAKKIENRKAEAKKAVENRLTASNPMAKPLDKTEEREIKYIPVIAEISKTAIDYGLKLPPSRMSDFESQILKILVEKLG